MSFDTEDEILKSKFPFFSGFLASNIYMEEVTSKEMRGTFMTLVGVFR